MGMWVDYVESGSVLPLQDSLEYYVIVKDDT